MIFSTSSFSSDRERLYGNWGNEAQCSRSLITPNGTKHFTPYDIRPDWLEYGGIWCRLTWTTTSSSEDGVFATAGALCGEDTVRDYQLRFDLIKDELTITWSQELKNGPLKRCVK